MTDAEIKAWADQVRPLVEETKAKCSNKDCAQEVWITAEQRMNKKFTCYTCGCVTFMKA